MPDEDKNHEKNQSNVQSSSKSYKEDHPKESTENNQSNVQSSSKSYKEDHPKESTENNQSNVQSSSKSYKEDDPKEIKEKDNPLIRTKSTAINETPTVNVPDDESSSSSEEDLTDHRKKVDYESAFELTGYGRMNHLVLISCCLIFVYCSLEMTGIAYIITPAECDVEMNVNQKSLVNAAVYIGDVISAVWWGSISDHYGRRKVILPAMIAAMIFSLLSSFSTSFSMLFSLRFITGILVSASSANILVYLSELHSRKYRNRAITIAITSDQINFIIIPGLAWLVIPGDWSFTIFSFVVKPWRVFMWLWPITGLLGTVILFKLPESPKYLLATKGSLETTTALAQIFAWNMHKKSEDYPVKSMKTDTQSLLAMKNESWKAIFSNLLIMIRHPLRRCFIITHFCMFMVNLLANGLYMWMPALINEMFKDISNPASICDMIYKKYRSSPEEQNDPWNHAGHWYPPFPHFDIREFRTFENEDEIERFTECTKSEVVTWTYPFSMLMEFIYLCPYLLVIIFVTRFSLQRIYGFVMIPCSFCLATSSVLPQRVLATVFLVLGLCSGSCTSVLSALTVAAFPTRLRALSMGTMFMVGQFGTIFGICMVGLMTPPICSVLFFLVACAVIGSALCLLFFWPDLTKIRHSMERIHFHY